MKKIIPILCLSSFWITFAQVGIGTLDPQATLDVHGDALVQDNFKISDLVKVTNTQEDFKLLTRLTNSNPVGKITTLDVDNLTVAPVNVIDYKFTNIHLDNLRDLDLQYDATKYVVGIANFRYVGDAIKKTVSGDTYSIGTFVVGTFIADNSWHLEIINRNLDLDIGDSLEYYVTLVIYNKSFFRNLDPITTDLGGNNFGTASSVPNLF